jgi:hypothetical protein
MLSYLFLAYEGNYVGKSPVGQYELFTYNGHLYMADPATDLVMTA